MATTEQPSTFSDLYTDLINRTRTDSSVTATTDQAKRYINIGLFDMHIGSWDRFPWAERNAILRTHPGLVAAGSETDGGVTATQGSTAITFTKDLGVTPWTIPSDTNAFGDANLRIGGKILIAGSTDPYELTAVSTSSATLQTMWLPDSVGPETGFTYYEDTYALVSDFLRPVDMQRFASAPIPINLIGRNLFRNNFPRDTFRGLPHIATIIDRSQTSETIRRIRLHKPPDAAYNIPYDYITNLLAVSSGGTGQAQLSADTDQPIVPLQYRMAIVFNSLHHWYRDRGDDLPRAQLVKQEYDELLTRIRADVEVGASRPQFRPKISSYRRRSRRPWGAGRGSRFDLGFFDQGGQ